MDISTTASPGRPVEEGLDETDRKFLLLITRGYNTSYAIWAYLKKNAESKGTKGMVYKNANRRILLLTRGDVIEEIKYAERTPHGRIEYKLTMKGLEELIPHFLSHPEEMKEFIKYIDSFGLDKKRIVLALTQGYRKTIKALNEFHLHSGRILYNPFRNTNYNTLESLESVEELILLQESYIDEVKTLLIQTQLSMNYMRESIEEIQIMTTQLKTIRAEMVKKTAKKLKNKKKPT